MRYNSAVVKSIVLLSLFLMQFASSFGSQFFFETTSLPEERQMYGGAVVGEYVYVIGGNRAGDGYSPNIKKAKIMPKVTPLLTERLETLILSPPSLWAPSYSV